MRMGSVACCKSSDGAAPALAEGEEGSGQGSTYSDNVHDDECKGSHTPIAPAGADDLEDHEMPVQVYTFSHTTLPDALPMSLYSPTRLSQGADLRVEDLGSTEVSDGVAAMDLALVIGGTRVTDYGALEDGGVLPTLIGGSAAAPASGSVGDIDSGGGGNGEDAVGTWGRTEVGLHFYTGGRLEIGVNASSIGVVALPGRMLAILDIVLACIMGPPSARQAAEMDTLEEEVAEEEEEEATGGYGDEVLAPSARWVVLESVRSAYLYFGRMDARFTVHVADFALLLPQDARDAFTNVIMAQVRRDE